jgi:hypothetical protein
MPEEEAKTNEKLQEALLSAVEEFSRENPQIIEAMQVMNMSMNDYLQAMESARGGQSASFTPIYHAPLQVG